jgi:hypothetical protein
MAILSTGNLLSEQRYDISDARRVESAVRNDFDTTVTSIFTNTSQGYIIRGFYLNTAGTIGSAANNLQLVVDPGAVLHIAASVSGTIFQTPVGTPPQTLNNTTNTNVSGSFTPGTNNYVGIDYNRFADPTTDVTKYIWNASANDDLPTIAPAAQTLTYKIVITNSVWAANVLPIAIVNVGFNGEVLYITEARWMLYSLETGGLNPNPNFVYPWTAGRLQPATTLSSLNPAATPFIGGDKQITCFKDWADAIMTELLGIKGTPYWFSGPNVGPGGGPLPTIQSLFQDLGNTVITGSGEISNGILPDSVPVLATTGNIIANSNQLTNLGSTVGLLIGQSIFGNGIRPGSTIVSIIGTTVTMSQVAAFNGTGIGASFYSPGVITAPGQINWDKPIDIRVIGSSLTYVLAANPTSTDITLADDEVAYIVLDREQVIAPNLIFTTGSKVVSSVGSVVWTTGLLPGDYIKISTDTTSGYYQIAPIRDITYPSGGILSGFAVGLATAVLVADSTGPTGTQAQFAFGSYSTSPFPSTNRDIFIAPRALVPVNGNIFWLFLREDNSGSPRVYIRFLAQELDNGESVEVSGTTSLEVLQYIGSPSASTSSPQYVATLTPGSLAQITNITIGSAATITSNQYFTLYSAGDFRKYYVWFNKDGTGVDPMVPGYNDQIQVAISTGMTSTSVAAALAAAFNAAPDSDFYAVAGAGTVVVTNRSSGASTSPSNFNVGAPFAISVSQSGTGTGNFVIRDGDSLTLAIKKLDEAIGVAVALYDESIDIVASGGTPPATPSNSPVSINGPLPSGTIIALPNNSRMSNIGEFYVVGDGRLEIYLNGVHLRLGDGWSEVGAFGSSSNLIQILSTYAEALVVGDYLEFIIHPVGGSQGLGTPGPAGPTGATGSPGADALNGPITISTKTSNYPVLLTDKFLLADCTTGPLTFTLPTAASAMSKVFYFKKIGSSLTNAMTIQANGAELIDGFNTKSTTILYKEYAAVSDGVFWWIF